MLERAHPFPPPEGVAGAFVSLSVPIRFRQAPQAADDEKLRYLNLKADLTLTLDGALYRGQGTGSRDQRGDRRQGYSDHHLQRRERAAEQLSNLAEQVKAAGFKFTVSPRPNPKVGLTMALADRCCDRRFSQSRTRRRSD